MSRSAYNQSAELTLELTPGGPEVEVYIEYRYSPGCGDYFAGGCQNPGDPAELNVNPVMRYVYAVKPPGAGNDDCVEFCAIGEFIEGVEKRLWEDGVGQDDGDDYEPQDYGHWKEDLE